MGRTDTLDLTHKMKHVDLKLLNKFYKRFP